jgi:hypothetical protein
MAGFYLVPKAVMLGPGSDLLKVQAKSEKLYFMRPLSENSTFGAFFNKIPKAESPRTNCHILSSYVKCSIVLATLYEPQHHNRWG